MRPAVLNPRPTLRNPLRPISGMSNPPSSAAAAVAAPAAAAGSAVASARLVPLSLPIISAACAPVTVMFTGPLRFTDLAVRLMICASPLVALAGFAAAPLVGLPALGVAAAPGTPASAGAADRPENKSMNFSKAGLRDFSMSDNIFSLITALMPPPLDFACSDN